MGTLSRERAHVYRAWHRTRSGKSIECDLGRALASARSLAELLGYTVNCGIPMSWDLDKATVWLPPDDNDV